MEPRSFVAPGHSVLVNLWRSQATPKSSNVLVEEPEQVEADTTSQKKEAQTLEFETSLDF